MDSSVQFVKHFEGPLELTPSSVLVFEVDTFTTDAHIDNMKSELAAHGIKAVFVRGKFACAFEPSKD